MHLHHRRWMETYQISKCTGRWGRSNWARRAGGPQQSAVILPAAAILHSKALQSLADNCSECLGVSATRSPAFPSTRNLNKGLRQRELVEQCVTSDTYNTVQKRGGLRIKNTELLLYNKEDPASCTVGTGGKGRPGRDADHSPPSSAEVKKE
jgi:hypothetical protein